MNQAAPEELQLIKYFNENPEEKTWNGDLTISGKKYLAVFNARRMKKSCLRCHGDPADAPQTMINQYGDKAGFFRPVGEVIALDTIAIPLNRIQQQLMDEIKNNFMLIGIGLLLLLQIRSRRYRI